MVSDSEWEDEEVNSAELISKHSFEKRKLGLLPQAKSGLTGGQHFTAQFHSVQTIRRNMMKEMDKQTREELLIERKTGQPYRDAEKWMKKRGIPRRFESANTEWKLDRRAW